MATVIDFAAGDKYGIKSDGSSTAGTRETLVSVANLIAWGELVMPLAAIYPFASSKDAYAELGRRKAHGKIVLALDSEIAEPRSSAFVCPVGSSERTEKDLLVRRDIGGVDKAGVKVDVAAHRPTVL